LGRKPGDFIWPEWFPPGHFEPFKRNARTWNALFQQRPAPETGDFFRAEWLRHYEQTPDRETLRVYGASDYAVTKDGGNYTVHVVVGIDPHNQIYLLDLWRKQTGADEWVEQMCNMVATWRPLGWAEESGQIRAGIGPYLHKRLMERQLYVVRAPFPSRVDKSVRAQSIRGRMAMNGLYVPTYAGWYPDFKAELMLFPNGSNDDQVDALSLIGQVLDKMQPGEKAKPPPAPPKVFSTHPEECTVTLDDMWEANDRRRKSRYLRIV
jgi:predicted phage terminase large subunit-like protein